MNNAKTALKAVVTVLAAAMTTVFTASAGDYHWAATNLEANTTCYWTNSENWVEGVVPTNMADNCYFEFPDSATNFTLTVDRAGTPVWANTSAVTKKNGISNIYLENGRLDLTNNLRTTKLNDTAITNVLFVGQGALLQLKTVYGPGAGAPYNPTHCLVKEGAGSVYATQGFGEHISYSAAIGRLHVKGGYFEINKDARVLNVIVHDGATYCNAIHNQGTDEHTYYTINRGGRVRLSDYGTPHFRGIEGEGDVDIYNGWSNSGLSLNFKTTSDFNYVGGTWAKGPYRFGGKIYRTCDRGVPSLFRLLPYETKSNTRTGKTETRNFIICGAKSLANDGGGKVVTAYYFNPYITPDFGRGVGEFWIVPWKAVAGVPINTEDEDGEPITLHMGIVADSLANAEITGSGSWYASGNMTTTVTGAQIRVTGTLGVDAGSTLVVGDNTAEGDVDLSAFAAIDVKGNLTINNTVKSTFNNDITVDGNLTLNGPCEFKGALTVGGKLTINGAATFAQTPTAGSYQLNSDLEISGREMTGLGIGAGTVTLLGSKIWNGYGSGPSSYEANYTTLKPQGGTVTASAATSRLVFGEGTEAILGTAESKMPSFTVKDGAKVAFTGNDAWGRSGQESTYAATVDGGTLELQNVVDIFPKDTGWKLKVGAKGAVVRDVFRGRNYFGSNNNKAKKWWQNQLAAESGVDAPAKDGGLDYELSGISYLLGAQDVTGPLTLGFGRYLISSASATLGLGDLILKDATLSVSEGATTDYDSHLASATGAKFVYSGAAVIDLGAKKHYGYDDQARTADQTVTIGPTGAGAFPIESAGKGSALYVGAYNALNGFGTATGAKVKVNGPVPTYADGRVKGAITSFQGSRLAFAKYDADLGFQRMDTSEYSTSLDCGADTVYWADTSSAALSISGEHSVGGVYLGFVSAVTLNKGATLHIGNGTDPAVVLCDYVAGNYSESRDALKGSGVLDFGTSEGYFICDARGHATYACYPIITCRVSGSNGVTFTAPLAVGACNPWMSFGADNTYTGGTEIHNVEVRATHAHAFGAGRVNVRGGRICGGGAVLNATGTWANDFSIRGFGLVQNHEAYGRGALRFAQPDTTVSGGVEIVDYARIVQGAGATSTVTIAGCVSGGDAQFYGDMGYAGTPADLRRRMILSGANTITGDVDVVKLDLVLAGANVSLGTADVLIDQAILGFENTADLVFANDLRGSGIVRLAGAGVTFTGELGKDGVSDLTLDIGGTSQVWAKLPAFNAFINSAEKAATVTLTADQTLDPAAFPANVNLVLDGAKLDLDGGELTVRRLTLKNGGEIVNGNAHETKPAQGVMLFVR